jgi:hypothetical protein
MIQPTTQYTAGVQEYAAREVTGIQPGHGDRRILGTVVYAHTRKQAEATEDGLRESHQISPNIRGRNYRVCIDGRFSDRPVRSEQSLESPAASGVVASAIRIPTSPLKNPTESSRAATFRILRGANRSRTYVSPTRPTPERLNWAILKPQRSSRFFTATARPSVQYSSQPYGTSRATHRTTATPMPSGSCR